MFVVMIYYDHSKGEANPMAEDSAECQLPSCTECYFNSLSYEKKQVLHISCLVEAQELFSLGRDRRGDRI